MCLDMSGLRSLSYVCANMKHIGRFIVRYAGQLGKSYGMFARMTLSYDCTFFALWLMALHKKCLGFREGRCVVNPLKKCGACIGGETNSVWLLRYR